MVKKMGNTIGCKGICATFGAVILNFFAIVTESKIILFSYNFLGHHKKNAKINLKLYLLLSMTHVSIVNV